MVVTLDPAALETEALEMEALEMEALAALEATAALADPVDSEALADSGEDSDPADGNPPIKANTQRCPVKTASSLVYEWPK